MAVQELIRPWRRSCDDHSPAHLRRLGAAQVVDGRAALPLDACHREQLEWLAEEVSQAGGEATVWVGELASVTQDHELAARMAEAVAADYRALIAAVAVAREEAVGRRRTLGRLRRELHRIRARDYFPPPEGELAQQAVSELSTPVEEPVRDDDALRLSGPLFDGIYEHRKRALVLGREPSRC